MFIKPDVFSSENRRFISKGRILYIDDSVFIKSVGYSLFFKREIDEKWVGLVTIKKSLISRLVITVPLFRRFFRKGIYKLLKIQENYVIFADKSIYLYQTELQSLSLIGNIRGSRPLYPCVYKDKIFYGEYLNNPQRESVNIKEYDLQNKKWKDSFRFDDIRHVHGIFSDPYTNFFWVTTGDLDHECKILYSRDELISFEVFSSGFQKFRAIFIHFDESSIAYGTDAPDEQNYIYELTRENASESARVPVGGPVFHGAVTPDLKVLTTAVEPSKVNKSEYAELWLLNSESKWVNPVKLKKDIFPKKLFQYGQILLPSGPGRKGIIAFTPLACEYNEKVIMLKYS